MKILDELIGLVSSRLHVFKTLLTMVKLEARLAGLSIFPVLLNMCLIFIILSTAWLAGMALAGFGVYQFYQNALIAILFVFVLNLAILALLFKYLQFNIRKMTFEKTRQFLTQSKEDQEHGLQKSDNEHYQENGQEA